MGGQILHSLTLSPRNTASVILQIAVVVLYSITREITETIRAGCGPYGINIPKYSKIMNSMPRNNG